MARSPRAVTPAKLTSHYEPMQQSLFNVRVPLAERGEVFLMNTLTDAQAIVPQSIDALLQSLDGRQFDATAVSRDTHEALGELADNGFIVSDHATERRALEQYFRDIRESRDELRVTVLTTLQCNFACDYCYQGDHPGAVSGDKMSFETAVRVGDWIERRLDEVGAERFSILFFGGEPLLNPGVVLYLSERLWKATRQRGVRMSSSIVTNGLLLSRDLVARLVAFGLRGIKVTLDGDRETHDRVRPLRGGQRTFDRIVENIRHVADLVAVSIGGNFDERTLESYPALLDFLSRQDFAPQLAKVAFKPIIRERPRPAGPRVIALTSVDASGNPLNGTCMTVAGTAAASMCDGCRLLDEKMAWLREETRRRGFPTVDGVHMGPCQIHCSNSHTIGPDGSLYACPGFTGDRRQAVGHIDGRDDAGLSRSAERFSAVAAWKQCGDCAFIPVCAGGCTLAAHAAYGDVNAPNCHKTSFELGVGTLAREAAASEVLACAS